MWNSCTTALMRDTAEGLLAECSMLIAYDQSSHPFEGLTALRK